MIEFASAKEADKLLYWGEKTQKMIEFASAKESMAVAKCLFLGYNLSVDSQLNIL